MDGRATAAGSTGGDGGPGRGPDPLASTRRGPGARVGDYLLGAPLGEGGFGAVYRATAPDGRAVAVKVLLRAEATARARFAREVEAVRRLDHPGIVRCLDHGEDGAGRPFLVLELAPGAPLDALAREGAPLPPAVAARAVRDAARAIAFAHGQGVLHRDVKPQNVLLDPATGTTRVLDFGLARLLGEDEQARLTRSGASLGTPAYMAPEQVSNERGAVDARADVWALGATLFHALTGQPPFSGVTSYELLAQLMTARPRPPSALAPGVPPALDRVCLRCLEKRPEDRFASAEALARALDDALRALEGGGAARARRGARGRGRRAGWIAAGGLAVAGVVVAVAERGRDGAVGDEPASAGAEAEAEARAVVDALLASAPALAREAQASAGAGSATSRPGGGGPDDGTARDVRPGAAPSALTALAAPGAHSPVAAPGAALRAALEQLASPRARAHARALLRARVRAAAREAWSARVAVLRAALDGAPDLASGAWLPEEDQAALRAALPDADAQARAEADALPLGERGPGPWPRARRRAEAAARAALARAAGGARGREELARRQAARLGEPAFDAAVVAALALAELLPTVEAPKPAPSTPGRLDDAPVSAPLPAPPAAGDGDLAGDVAAIGALARALADDGRAAALAAALARVGAAGAPDARRWALERFEEAGNLSPYLEALALPEAIDWGPLAGWAHELRAMVRQDRGDHAGALRDLERAVALEPDLRPRAWRMRGQLRARGGHGGGGAAPGDVTAALADAERALALDPEDALSWLVLAALLDAAGEHPRAAEAATRALGLDPFEPAAWVRRALCQLHQGREDDALEDLRRALTLAPTHGQALGARGALRVQLGDPAGGALDLEAALVALPDAPELWTHLAVARRDARAPRAAVLEAVERALALDPDQVDALTLRGLLRRQTDPAGAEADLRRALELADPRRRAAIEGLLRRE